jgi:hypothetical protein
MINNFISDAFDTTIYVTIPGDPVKIYTSHICRIYRRRNLLETSISELFTWKNYRSSSMQTKFYILCVITFHKINQKKKKVSWYFSPTTGEESIFKMNSFLKFGLKHCLPKERMNRIESIEFYSHQFWKRSISR